MLRTDVLIIGAGAVGSSLARELSKYEVDVLVVDKNEDIGGDASKSNSAIIHTGFDAAPGSLESKLVVSANPMYDELCKNLDVPFERVGAILPAISEEELINLKSIKKKAFLNNVYDVEYLSSLDVLKLEGNVNPDVLAGLYIPRESIIDPFLFVVALCENAYDNGVKFMLNTKVMDIIVEDKKVKYVKTNSCDIEAKYVINCAGLFSDAIAKMVHKDNFYVNPRKGQFFILDKNTSCKVSKIILPVPTKLTKGKLIAPTIDGNMLVGPTAEELTDKEDKSTTSEGLDEIEKGVKKLVPNINIKDTITQYCGLRPNRNPEGVNIDVFDDIYGYVQLSGIRSTGLTASISVSKYVVDLLFENGLDVKFKENYNGYRIGIKKFSNLSNKDREDLIKQNPRYGKVICRCETITEAEIIEAINRPIGAKSVDAIKRRTRAGLGRCQGGFCGPRVIEILRRELGIKEEDVLKGNIGSNMVIGKIR